MTALENVSRPHNIITLNSTVGRVYCAKCTENRTFTFTNKDSPVSRLFRASYRVLILAQNYVNAMCKIIKES